MKIEKIENGEPPVEPLSRKLTVAVCIGTYNQAPFLRECVESILAQSYPVSEIWISDDASTDNTAEVLAELGRLYPTVHCYRQPVNLGIAGNLSWVLAQPQTDLIGRIDSDDRYEPEYIATLVRLLAEHPQAGYAHCDIHEINSAGERLRVRRLSRSAAYEPPDVALRRSASGYRVAANCLLYRAQALRQADYYHPNAGWRSAEDWDLVLRITIHGWGNAYAPQPLASYRVWDDEQQTRFRRRSGELESLIKIYRDRLEPAYLRRGWSTAPLRKYRINRALWFVDTQSSSQLRLEEKRQFRQRMLVLGDSFSLRFWLLMSAVGLGPLLPRYFALKFRAYDGVKSVLRRLRGR